MQAMMNFATWFLQQIPSFLLSEPISAFTAIAILLWVGALVSQMIHLR